MNFKKSWNLLLMLVSLPTERLAFATGRSLDPKPTFLESYGAYFQWGCGILGVLGLLYSFIAIDRTTRFVGRVVGAIGCIGFCGLWLVNNWVLVTTSLAIIAFAMMMTHTEA